MKFCSVVPEICRGQVHGARKERRIIIIIRNGAKTISLQTLFGRLNNMETIKKHNRKDIIIKVVTALNFTINVKLEHVSNPWSHRY